MESHILLLILVSSATAHLIMASVMALYARYQVKYLCLAWIDGIFGAVLIATSFFSQQVTIGEPGIMHPGMLLALLCACYLQSIYPLSIPMPGFLQWRRMWKYASPAILLLGIYLLAKLMGSKIILMYSINEFAKNILSGDVLLRLTALGISVYYIINIFRLPHHMAHNSNVPRYLLGYCFFLGLSVVYYTFVAIFYHPYALMLYIVIFTLLNLYLMYRTLEDIAINLPKPTIEEVKEEPSEDVLEKAEKEDFNEANLQRFNRIQYWMQNHKDEWKDNTFGRDKLCEEVGYNRHLLLQSVRSQGFNNVHDYINRYRIDELKRMIQRGEITTISETYDVGFGTTKTARSCFEKMEGISLDEYLAKQQKS